MSIRIVSFTHNAPYDGCFWETHYLALIKEKNEPAEIHPIVWPTGGRHVLPSNLHELAESAWCDDLEITQWEEKYPFVEHWIPSFYRFAEDHNLPFTWECAYCGETKEPPLDHGGDYGGNGGIGIVVYSWLCEECYCMLSCGYCGQLNVPDDNGDSWWSYDEGLTRLHKMGVCPACNHGYIDGQNVDYAWVWEDITVLLWTIGYKDRRTTLGYSLSDKDKVIFEGADLSRPGYGHETEDSVYTLLGFLTLRPGDTDEEYFDSYTPEQLEWVQSDSAEELRYQVMEWEEE